jgi:hypothetical protein
MSNNQKKPSSPALSGQPQHSVTLGSRSSNSTPVNQEPGNFAQEVDVNMDGSENPNRPINPGAGSVEDIEVNGDVP